MTDTCPLRRREIAEQERREREGMRLMREREERENLLRERQRLEMERQKLERERMERERLERERLRIEQVNPPGVFKASSSHSFPKGDLWCDTAQRSMLVIGNRCPKKKKTSTQCLSVLCIMQFTRSTAQTFTVRKE